MAIDVARTASPIELRRRLRQQHDDQRTKSHKQSRTDAPIMPAMKTESGCGGSWRTLGTDPTTIMAAKTTRMNDASQIKTALGRCRVFFWMLSDVSFMFVETWQGAGDGLYSPFHIINISECRSLRFGIATRRFSRLAAYGGDQFGQQPSLFLQCLEQRRSRRGMCAPGGLWRVR